MRRRSRYAAERFSVQDAPAPQRTDPPPQQAQEPPRYGDRPEQRARAIHLPVELPRGNRLSGAGEAAREAAADPGAGASAPEGSSAGKVKNAARGGFSLPAALRGIFGNLGEEETEKMFILALCLLLSQENGDEGLLLSLLYLLT